MKRSVNYLLCGLLTLLGFTSCAALRDARQARLEREREPARRRRRVIAAEGAHAVRIHFAEAMWTLHAAHSPFVVF